jgi:hypothetical protein
MLERVYRHRSDPAVGAAVEPMERMFGSLRGADGDHGGLDR